jgi:hypothetical protein
MFSKFKFCVIGKIYKLFVFTYENYIYFQILEF